MLIFQFYFLPSDCLFQLKFCEKQMERLSKKAEKDQKVILIKKKLQIKSSNLLTIGKLVSHQFNMDKTNKP